MPDVTLELPREADADLPTAAPENPLITDVLVEEVSIDGMCGVY